VTFLVTVVKHDSPSGTFARDRRLHQFLRLADPLPRWFMTMKISNPLSAIPMPTNWPVRSVSPSSRSADRHDE
jgi:hypothetical protein